MGQRLFAMKRIRVDRINGEDVEIVSLTPIGKPQRGSCIPDSPEKLLRSIGKNGMTKAEAYRKMRITSSEMTQLINLLVAENRIALKEVPAGSRGPKATFLTRV